jgi:hypothetical protein
MKQLWFPYLFFINLVPLPCYAYFCANQFWMKATFFPLNWIIGKRESHQTFRLSLILLTVYSDYKWIISGNRAEVS